MKRIKEIGFLLTLIIIFSGCEETKDPAGRRSVGVVPVITDAAGGFINGEPGSTVSFSVSLPGGVTVENAQIQVAHEGNMVRAKLSDVASFPASVSITLGDVISKLGLSQDDIQNGDIIFIEVVTEKDGLTTRSNAALQITVLCTFEPALAAGNYHSVSAPEEWNSEGNITITADPEDPFKLYVKGIEALEGVNEDGGPLVLHINQGSFAVTADKTVLASEAFGDTNLAYEGTGLFNSCTGTYSMDFHITTDQSDYGTYHFTFTRNN
jgi:hypothetical protein